MNPKKKGTMFVLLMIGLIAFGFASAAHALGFANDFGTDMLPSNFGLSGDQKISEISDPSFKPVYLNMRIMANNTTNSTNRTNLTRNASNESQ